MLQTRQPYTYVNGDPLNATDPLGLAFTIRDEGACDPIPTGPTPTPTAVNPTQTSLTSSSAPCAKPDVLTVGVGAVTSFGLFVLGGAFFIAGAGVAGAGIAEGGATGGAGLLVTLLAVHEGVELAAAGGTAIAAGALLASQTVGRAFQCGGVR